MNAGRDPASKLAKKKYNEHIKKFIESANSVLATN